MMPPQKTSSSTSALLAFMTRLHFYIGLFVGPFIFIAALTGTLYVITPQIEQQIYHHELTTPNRGAFHSLNDQIQVARHSLPKDLLLKAVRPSIGEGYTTRVLFKDPSLYGWELQTVFVDPVSLEIRGKLASYGTSGILPLRIKLDYLHQNLLLGQWGRYYSELAASWMWLAALGGLIQWWTSRYRYQSARKKRIKEKRTPTRNPYLRNRHRHTTAGLIIALGLFFISATGLTWSKWAGGNIAHWRQTIGWVTPSVSLKLAAPIGSAPDSSPHAQPNTGDAASPFVHHNDALFDGVRHAARAAGIDAAKLEIRPASNTTQAWQVREIDRSWPTQVDSVAVNPYTMTVTSRADFKDFPLVAKLIRWGIDAHMGVLFGLPNQMLLAAFGLTLCMMVIWGYRMWWKRRPPAGSPIQTLTQTWFAMTRGQRLTTLIVAGLLSIIMPVMGISFIVFILVDILRWWRAQLALVGKIIN